MKMANKREKIVTVEEKIKVIVTKKAYAGDEMAGKTKSF